MRGDLHQKHLWIAPWQSLKKQKALKEFSIQKELGRPHAPKAFKLKKRPFLWSLEQEKVKGPFLDEILRDKKRFPFSSKELIKKTLLILKKLHHKGWVHGDLAPEHIALRVANKGSPPSVLLIDFGTSAHEQLRSKTGSSPEGKIRYASPARLQEAHCLPADDLFSLAVIAFEITYRCPWTPYPETSLNLPDRQGYLIQKIKEVFEDKSCPEWIQKGFRLGLSADSKADDWLSTL